MNPTTPQQQDTHLVEIASGPLNLQADLKVPQLAQGAVLFAHGSGSSRHSPRNQYVAGILNQAGLATLLLDLLTPDEEEAERSTRHLRFNINMLAERLIHATDWLIQSPLTQNLKIGYFGASTGAAAALVAAADRPKAIRAIVSRGGRPDLAGPTLPQVQAPTLLIVGGEDKPVITMNQDALTQIQAVKKLEIIPGATHLFEEPGALEVVAQIAQQWFEQYLA